MGDWSNIGDGQRYENSVSGVDHTVVTSAGTANTKGAWVELIAATAFDARMLIVEFGRHPPAGLNFLTDLGVGAAGSETVLVADLCSSPGPGAFASVRNFFFLPIAIPSGTRISARTAATQATQTVRMAVLLGATGFFAASPLATIDTYGAVTADSGGTAVDSGAVANTKGAWVEMVASCQRVSLLYSICHSALNAVQSAQNRSMDIGIGAAGSEKVILPDIRRGVDTATDMPNPQTLGPFAVAIPAGTRIAIREASSITDATDRIMDHVLYGVR